MSIQSYTKVWLFFLALGLQACSLLLWDTPQVEQEEQAVYSAVFKGSERVVILQDTTMGMWEGQAPAIYSMVKKNFNNISQSTIDNFFHRNAKSSRLSPDMDLEMPYHLISNEERDHIYTPFGGWKNFQKKYPGSYGSGFVQISRVGFNNWLDQALIYVNQVDWDGAAYYYLLEKKEDGWHIIEEYLLFISCL
jgi:hypothetical protein